MFRRRGSIFFLYTSYAHKIYHAPSYTQPLKHTNNTVWSECSVDDWNDDQAGDNRDGDEKWYQYRTQAFCANAAYSLYGKKKSQRFNSFGKSCSKGHYINSYFTYGGSDSLLSAVGETPIVYGGKDSNSECVDASEDGYGSSTLGCDTDGNYIMGSFNSESCDGNYFTDVIDTFDGYNDQFDGVGCTSIWDKSSYVEGVADELYELLTNSWTCDMRLYPHACLDPYGKKAQHDFALRTASHGGNPMMAYMNIELAVPIRIASCVIMILSLVILGISYCIKNKSKVKAAKSLSSPEKGTYVGAYDNSPGSTVSGGSSGGSPVSPSNMNDSPIVAQEYVSGVTKDETVKDLFINMKEETVEGIDSIEASGGQEGIEMTRSSSDGSGSEYVM